MGLSLGVPERAFHPTDEYDEIIPYKSLDPRVYLRFATEDGEPLGEVTFRLSLQLQPKLSDNFRQLCVGYEKLVDKGLKLQYKGSILHTICSERGIVAGGDVLFHNGSGGHAASLNGVVEESSSSLNYIRPGTLCMLNQMPKLNRFDSQFFIIVDPNRVEFLEDGVVFGYAEEGLHVLQKILREYGTSSGVPLRRVRVVDCGQY